MPDLPRTDPMVLWVAFFSGVIFGLALRGWLDW